MIVSSDILVNASSSRAWDVIAGQFGDISHWASQVSRSNFRTKNKNTLLGGTRTCTVEGFGELIELVDTYDAKNMCYTYLIGGRLPFPIKKGKNVWYVKPVSDTKAIVGVSIELKLVPGIGTLMAPLLTMKLRSNQPRLLEELAHYIETDRPHQRTLARIKKQPVAA